MTTVKCGCPFCTDPQRPIYAHTDEALWWLVQTRDDIHDKRKRVYAYIHLFYRAGITDPFMPYRVWLTIMGPDIDPPFVNKTTNGIGAFQVPRLPDGTLTDGEWWWCDVVGRDMQWPD